MGEKVFSSLKFLGLEVEELEIYEEKKEEIKKEENVLQQTKEVDINTLLYNRTVSCPVCNNEFICKGVKSSAPRIKRRDSDLFIRYHNINPYFYDVLLCPRCGYAALKSDFSQIKAKQINNILMKVSSNWKGRYYPPIHNETIAIERYKLALFNAVVADRKDSTKAFICLKIAWMYRLLEDENNEKDFLKKALQGFLIAFKEEATPICGLNEHSMMYLIGELYRRVENYEEANNWLGKVIVSVRAEQRIKEKARDMRDLSRMAQKKLENN